MNRAYDTRRHHFAVQVRFLVRGRCNLLYTTSKKEASHVQDPAIIAVFGTWLWFFVRVAAALCLALLAARALRKGRRNRARWQARARGRAPSQGAGRSLGFSRVGADV